MDIDNDWLRVECNISVGNTERDALALTREIGASLSSNFIGQSGIFVNGSDSVSGLQNGYSH